MTSYCTSHYDFRLMDLIFAGISATKLGLPIATRIAKPLELVAAINNKTVL